MEELIKALIPSVSSSHFGKKMFARIAKINNANKVAEHLRYHPGASGAQRMVFNYLADLAESGQLEKVKQIINL